MASNDRILLNDELQTVEGSGRGLFKILFEHFCNYIEESHDETSD
jgi:hypothetical protein